MLQRTTDLLVVGAGIVGVATALELQRRYPTKQILLVEKESSFAKHQTGRNSGVVHAGVYYQPASLKANLCRQGLQDTLSFCNKYNIEYQQCGKLIVATNEQEQQRLEALFVRCQQNDLQPQRISASKLTELEPNIVGKEAVFIKQTAITSYTRITEVMLELFLNLGGEVQFNQTVSHIQEQQNDALVFTTQQRISCQFVVNCSGILTDRLARSSGLALDFRIIPFKGEYYQLPRHFDSIVNHLIYPVPDPQLPFLGVHLTKMIEGYTTVGPNAVLALAREGYSKLAINLNDLADTLSYPGFWKLIARYPSSTLQEFKTWAMKHQYLRQVQKYCPQIQRGDLQSYPCGIRAQAVDNAGNLIHDFKFVETQRCLHVGNAPSPAATSAMPIGRLIVDKVDRLLG